jgi:flagellar hook protein FlgE
LGRLLTPAEETALLAQGNSIGFGAGTVSSGSYAGAITIDFSGLRQFGDQNSTASMRDRDGNPPGTQSELTVGPSGVITARYSNGLTRVLGQIPVARFPNAAGLQKIGNNLFVPTPNSGPFDGTGEDVGMDGSSIMGGVLEMSNVDLANEFTNIITTQRGFQANSRIISTSDEMLQELVNLKR